MINNGIIFGINGNYSLLFLVCIIGLIVLFAISKDMRLFLRYSILAKIGLFVALVGGFLNMFENLCYGGVNDFIELENVAFNANDILIFAGVVLMNVAFIKLVIKKKGKNNEDN